MSSPWALASSGSRWKYRPEPPPLRADGDGADGRDPVVPVPALEDRRLAPGGEGAADRRGEHEPRLVEEHQVGLAAPGLPDDRGQFLTPSVVDGHLVPLPGLPLGLLAGPASRRLRILRTCSGWKWMRKCRSISSATRAAVHSSVRQPWALAPFSSRPSSSVSWSAESRGLGPGWGLAASASERLPGELDPGVDGGAAAAEEAGDVVGGFALLDQLDGPEAAALEFFGGSDGSHTISTSRTIGIVQLARLESVRRVTNPARQSLASSRKRVLRGAGVTRRCEA